MSERKNIFSPFENFPFFTKVQLLEYAKKHTIKKNTLNSYINKSLKEGQIVSLKRNYYTTRSYYDNHKTETNYLFYLANALLKPSYISLESALQYYGLYAEGINYTITSLTLKTPRSFQNRIARYTYNKISEKLFIDFTMLNNENGFLIALPHKAIFDFLYFKTNRFSKNLHPDILEELRIDTDSLSKSEKIKLKNLLSKFTKIKIHI